MKNYSLVLSFLFLISGVCASAQQLPNNTFEDWSGEEFDGNIQPKSWHYSNVTQFGFKFNFAERVAGHSGYGMKVQDKSVGAAGITEVSPGYISLGQPWVYVESLTKVDQATAGTYGGIAWAYRPDTMSVWIKRTGDNTADEDFHLLYYAWTGTACGDNYKGKNGSCTSVRQIDEESDIRQSLDGNECGTTTAAHEVAEGWVYGRKTYNEWTQIKVPIYYTDNTVPEKANVIFSASNYPNFRANSGLYAGNSLYIDDVQLIYSSKIQQLFISGKEWKNFNPNSTAIQTYVLGDAAYSIPAISAYRGSGQLTNSRGITTTFMGRQLQGSEISITEGVIDETPTLITVRAEDGSSETTYRIMFAHKPSDISYLSGINVNGKPIASFNQYLTEYTVEVEYGSSAAPVISVVKQEEQQTVSFTQPSSINDVTTIVVTAADGIHTTTYTIRYRQGQLKDNTLAGIKVNGYPLSNFDPNTTRYTIKLPIGTTELPSIEPISKYAAGLQTIVATPPAKIDGGVYQIAVSTPGAPTPLVYKLTIKLEPSDNCNLQDIHIDGASLSNFSPSTTSYIVQLPVGTTTLPTVTPVAGDEYQTVTQTTNGNTVLITVTAANGIQQVYKVVFNIAKSTISTLSGITLDGVMIEEFDPSITSYSVQLPIGTTDLPQIQVIKGDPYETVTIRTYGLNGTTRISVQAGDGSTTVYQIAFSVSQATNATLKGITINGTELADFDPNIMEYTYTLPQGTTELPSIGYTPYDQYQTITTRSNGINGDYRITVRPQSGSSKTYIIHFSVIKSDDAYLEMIYLNGTPLSQFDKDTLQYTCVREGNSTPAIAYLAKEGQKTYSYLNDNVYTIKVTAESGRSNIYTITFVVELSDNAFLEMIYLDNDSLDGFEPTKTQYTNLYLSDGQCPEISVESALGQQVTILSPSGAGTASIYVTPSTGGKPNIYQLIFIDTTAAPVPHLDPVEEYIPSSDATLLTILADSIELADFDPTKEEYEIQLEAGATLPVITFLPKDNHQSLISGRIAPQVYQAQVTAEDGQHTSTYKVSISQAPYSNAYLKDLHIDGKDLSFVPETLTYHLMLDEGQSLPSMSYQTNPGQTVMQHAINDTTQQLIVTAQNGNQNTYIITYTRALSHNAYLKDILIDGNSMDGFNKDIRNYTYPLPFRTAVVPSINAIGEVTGQTITTYFSAVNGTTRIHVVAEDGLSSGDYYISFPVDPSQNVALKSLTVSDGDLNFDADITDYTVLINYNAACAPYITFEKGEKEQTVTYIAAAIGDTSKVIVRAQNGHERTYSVLFQREENTDHKPNILQSIFVHIDSLNRNIQLDLSDVNQRSFDVALPYGSAGLSVSYQKNFGEQTVLVEPGGLYRPTTLTVLSNNGVQPTTVYTIHPQLDTNNPAVLTSIKVDGVVLDEFSSNRFNYIINRNNANTWPEVEISKAEGVSVHQTSNPWKSQIVVTCGSYTNTYLIFFHYPNDIIPNGEFDQWTTTSSSATNKPTNWNVPGDYLNTYASTAKAGNTVSKDGSSAVHLKTTYWAALMGAVPAVMNLGDMAASFAVAGGTRVVPYGSIAYHNSPDYAIINYKYPDKQGNGALFRFKFTDTSSETYTYDFNATNSTNNYSDYFINLGTAGKNILNMDIIIDATGQYPDASSNANLYVDYIRFAYNNTLNGLFVNDIAASLTDHAFTATLEDAEAIALPHLTFQQGVSDQAQKVTWDTPYRDGNYSIRKAVITNYGEDGQSTDYTLEVKRPLSTNAYLSNIQIKGTQGFQFKPTQTNYTYFLDYGTKSIPDVIPTLSSNLQQCQTTLNDSTVSIIVTAESGVERTYQIRFTIDNDTATLKNIAAEGLEDFQPEKLEYTITANEWPTIAIQKRYDAQQVTMTEGVIDVTAANGSHLQYRITLKAPVTSTSGQFSEMELDGMPFGAFAPNQYEYEIERPTWVAFTRHDATDSVIYTQTPDSLTWQVYGTDSHRYLLTPLITQSTTTYLKGIYVNDELIDGFDPKTYEYPILCDTAVQLRAEGMSDDQIILIQQDNSQYTIFVTAQNGEQGTPYRVTLLPVTTADATLSAIYVNGKLVNNFSPQTSHYDIVIPTGSYKVTEPAMPPITYSTSDPKAKVDIEAGMLNDTTRLVVISSDGFQRKEYTLAISSEPSHNAKLTAIAVNDLPIDNFDPYRTVYAAQTTSASVKFDWRSDDRFQTITVDTVTDKQFILHVLAQDKIIQTDYTIELFAQSLSNDATLANITLDGQAMSAFLTELNENLVFNPGMNRYVIHVPSTIRELPEVAATLKRNDQSLAMRQEKDTIFLDVTAEDNSKNIYTLQFVRTLSSNALLNGFYLDGDSLEGFQSNKFFYLINIPSGQSIPAIDPMVESSQRWMVDTAHISLGTQISFTVTSEDKAHQAQYTLLFQKTLSGIDTLESIIADSLEFKSGVFEYNCSWPYGDLPFPELEVVTGDPFQTYRIDTLTQTSLSLSRQVVVTAENGQRNRYTITYTMHPSTVTTLKNIWVNIVDSLPNFHPYTTEYIYTLPTGSTSLPLVEPIPGDHTQTIDTATMASSELSDALATYQIIVTAQNGDKRIYSILFIVAPDTISTLTMINYNSKQVPRYNESLTSYSISLTAEETQLPIITYSKHNEKQLVDIQITDSNSVQLVVTAADGVSTTTYSLTFLPYVSDNGQLEAILLADTLMENFSATKDNYEITIDSLSSLPEITCILGESTQSVIITTTYYYTTDSLVYDVLKVIKVVPENQTDTFYYEITFHIKSNTPLRPDENTNLIALNVRGQLISQSDGFDYNFSTNTFDYHMTYPIGTNPDMFFTDKDITALTEDTAARIVAKTSQTILTAIDTAGIETIVSSCIHVVVMAADGVRNTTYNIFQELILDSLNQVTQLLIADQYGEMQPINDFNSNVYYYEYTLSDTRSNTPDFTLAYANTSSRFAYITFERSNNCRIVEADDNINYAIEEAEDDPTYHISYTAENGAKYTYRIKFRRSEIKRSQKAMSGDVLIQHIPGTTQIAIASLRANVVFGLYDMTGRLVEYVKLEEGNPNNYETITDGYGQTYFGHLSDFSSCTILTLEPNKIYFWSFCENGKRKIKSGKLIILP